MKGSHPTFGGGVCVMNGQVQWNLISYLIEALDAGGTPLAGVITVGGILLCMLIPYLLGSFNFGLIISQKKYHDDIRTHGSGNAGTTNMLRTYGKKAAILTLLGDMAKAAVAVTLGYLIADGTVTITEAGEAPARMINHYGAAIAGLFVMLGHMFPVFYKFKGGKGVATSAMVILMLSPISFVFCFAIFVIIVVGTRYVSLGSCMGMIFYPIILKAFSGQQNFVAQGMAVLMACLVVFMHRENLKRLAQGKESKLTFKKKDVPPPAASAPADGAPTEADAPADTSAPDVPSAAPNRNTSKKKLARQKKK